jgi:ABC-type antimicrobial peptide transport system permease subunit
VERRNSSVGAITGSVLLLSAAGLYALMAFTVAQRRREIGIRSALGAQPGHLVAAVFRRVFWQIGAGSAAGILAAYVAGRYVPIEQVGGLPIPGILPGAAAFMLLVGVADDCFDSGDDLAGRVAWEQSAIQCGQRQHDIR